MWPVSRIAEYSRWLVLFAWAAYSICTRDSSIKRVEHVTRWFTTYCRCERGQRRTALRRDRTCECAQAAHLPSDPTATDRLEALHPATASTLPPSAEWQIQLMVDKPQPSKFNAVNRVMCLLRFCVGQGQGSLRQQLGQSVTLLLHRCHSALLSRCQIHDRIPLVISVSSAPLTQVTHGHLMMTQAETHKANAASAITDQRAKVH